MSNTGRYDPCTAVDLCICPCSAEGRKLIEAHFFLSRGFIPVCPNTGNCLELILTCGLVRVALGSEVLPNL